jgi:alkanesulfonate monooxygenase SsuD/methylene tetrahydromethanopterin reductase-like flavin-dependent oxidoreductase (luciferase family)
MDQVVDVAVEAEQLGFYDAGGNDHLSTMRFVREAWPEPPDYFEPLVTLAAVAARTSVLRLSTAILQLLLRQSVLLAKQITTLEHLSRGRVIIGVAVGGYRDEFEGVLPDLAAAPRAAIVRERLEALRALFEQKRATYRGAYDHFEDVEMYPKPKGIDIDKYLETNLVGTPDQVCAKVAALKEAGVDHLCGLLFVGNTVGEMRAQMKAFAAHVIPAFPETRRSI